MSGISELPCELLIEIQLLLPREEQGRLGRCSKLFCKKILDNSDFWLKLVCDRWAHGSVVEHYASFRTDGFPIRWKEALYYFEKELPKKEKMVRASEADSRIRKLYLSGSAPCWPKVNVLGEIGLAIERGAWKGKPLSLSFGSCPPEEQGFDKLVHCLGLTNQSFLTEFRLNGDYMWAMNSFVDALPQLIHLERLQLNVGPQAVVDCESSGSFRSKSLHWDLDLFSRFVDVLVESDHHPLKRLTVAGLNDTHCEVAGKMCLAAGRHSTKPLKLDFSCNEFSDDGINVLLSSIEKHASSFLDSSRADQPVVVVKDGKYESGPAFRIDLSNQGINEVDYKNKIVREDTLELTSSDASYHSLGRLLSSPVGSLLASVHYDCQVASDDAIKALVAGARQAASLIELYIDSDKLSGNEWRFSSLAGLWEPDAKHQLQVIGIASSDLTFVYGDGHSRIRNNLDDAHNLINVIEKAKWRGEIDVGNTCLHCFVAELQGRSCVYQHELCDYQQRQRGYHACFNN